MLAGNAAKNLQQAGTSTWPTVHGSSSADCIQLGHTDVSIAKGKTEGIRVSRPGKSSSPLHLRTVTFLN